MNKSELLRYLAAPPDTHALDDVIERAVREIEAHSVVRSVYRRYPVTVTEDCVTLSAIRIDSRDLARHLRGCREAFALALTLGPQIDALIRRAEIGEMGFVPVLQAAATAKIEEAADALEQELQASVQPESLVLRPRFSPGYGDFALETQKELFRLLDITKTIGITLTGANLMQPLKSITALVGLAPESNA